MTIITSTSITTEIGKPANLYVPSGTTGLSVAAAVRYLKLTPNAGFVSIKDTTLNIQRNLASLQTYSGYIDKLEATESSAVLTVTHKDYLAYSGAIADWKSTTGLNSSAQKFNITDITAANATSLWGVPANRDFINKLSVKDTAINLQTNYDFLRAITAVDTVSQTNISSVITLSVDQYKAGIGEGNFLSKINKGSYNLSITGASVSDVLTNADLGQTDTGPGLGLGAKSQIKTISIVSTTQSIDDSISKLQKYGLKIRSIAQSASETDMVLDLTATEIKNNLSIIGKITTGYRLHAENTSSAQLSSILSNRKVISVDIVDNSSNIGKNWATLNAINTDTLNSVTVSDDNTSSSGVIKITAAQLALGKDLIKKFINPLVSSTTTNSFTFEIADATASQASEFLSVKEISKFTVTDTASNIMGYIDELGSSKVNAIKMSNSSILEMDYDTYSNGNVKSTLDKINKGAYNVRLSNISVADALATAALYKGIEGFEISDLASNIDSTALDSLNLLGSRLKSIDIALTSPLTSLSDPDDINADKKITISANSFMNRQSVLTKINHGYTASLTGATVKQAIALSSNIHVADLDISDSVQNITSNWDNLLTIKSKLDDFTTNLSVEATITADQYERGLASELQSKFVEVDVDADPDTTTRLKFKVLDATIAQATTLLTNDTNNIIQHITIKDSTDNVSENLSTLQSMITPVDITAGDRLINIKLTDIDKIDINYADVTTYKDVLDTINGGSYRLNVSDVAADKALALAASSKVSTMIIESTADDISTNFDDLLKVQNKISSLLVSDYADANIALTYSQYQSGKPFLNKLQENYFLKITDAPVYIASSIASNDHVKDIEVKGTASLISKTWDMLVGLGEKITSIVKSANEGIIDLSYTQWTKVSDLFGKFVDQTSKFNVSDVSISNLNLVASDTTRINQISVRDDAQNISSDFYVDLDTAAATKLKTNLDKINEIVLTNSSVAIEVPTITSDINDVLRKIKSNNYLLTLNSASVAEAKSLAIDNSKTLVGNTSNADKPFYENIKSINIVTTDKNLVTNEWDSLKTISKLNSIALPAADETLALTATKVLDSTALLDKILSYQINVSNSSMAQLVELNKLKNISNVSIEDSNINIYNNFDNIINLKPNLTDITITSTNKDFNITYDQWSASSTKLSTLPAATVNPFSFNLSSVFADDVTTSILTNSSIQTIQVRDSAVSIGRNWDALNTAYGPAGAPGKLTGLSFYKIEADNPREQVPDFGYISLTSSQLLDTTSRLLTLVPVENSIELKDTPESIQTNWDALVTKFAAGTFQSVSLSYASVPDKITINAAQADAGVELMNKFPPGTFIVTTA